MFVFWEQMVCFRNFIQRKPAKPSDDSNGLNIGAVLPATNFNDGTDLDDRAASGIIQAVRRSQLITALL